MNTYADEAKKPADGGMSLKLEKILVPTDFSELSLEALHIAQGLNKGRPQASVTLLNVAEPLAAFTPGGFDGVPMVDVDRAMLLSNTELNRLAHKAELTGKPVHPKLVSGSPSGAIVEAAGDGIDLIVMSSHGRSGFKRLFLGSVAEAVVANAPCPVLVVKGHPSPELMASGGSERHRIKRIVVGYDERAGGLKAARMAAALAAQFQAEVTLVHALPPAVEEDEQALLAAARLRLRDADVSHAHLHPTHPYRAKSGEPWEVLAEAATKYHADLVIVGPHSDQHRALHLLGSTAQRLVREAHCSVLALK